MILAILALAAATPAATSGEIQGHAVVECRVTAAGWLRKLAIRQNRWPVVTFSNECS